MVGVPPPAVELVVLVVEMAVEVVLKGDGDDGSGDAGNRKESPHNPPCWTT